MKRNNYSINNIPDSVIRISEDLYKTDNTMVRYNYIQRLKDIESFVRESIRKSEENNRMFRKKSN